MGNCRFYFRCPYILEEVHVGIVRLGEYTVRMTDVINTYLTDNNKSEDVRHGYGFVGSHNYFPRLLAELDANFLQVERFGFRSSAYGQAEENTVRHLILYYTLIKRGGYKNLGFLEKL